MGGTMKSLRTVIRKIILENSGEYDELVKMLCSDNTISVNQALEFAKSLEFVSDVSYELKDIDGTNRHVWEFTPTDEFMNEIESYWSTRPRTQPSYSDSMHSIFPVGSTGKVKILLSDSNL